LKKPSDLNPEESDPVTPAFPRWERSFVSGPASTLFQVEHFISRQDSLVLFTKVRFLPHSEGPPGHVHGGATAGLLDETMGILVWHHGHFAVTQNLRVEFKKPIPLHEPCLVVTRIETTGEGKIEVSSGVFDSAEHLRVSARGLFHKLSREQIDRFK
jgi:acyl-coenzyme A thioesterase PaaI-like protein